MIFMTTRSDYNICSGFVKCYDPNNSDKYRLNA